MVATGIATLLAALLLPVLCLVAGAPTFPPDGSDFFNRPFADASHLLNAAVDQPGHGQRGIGPAANANHNTDGQAWSYSPWSPQVLHPHIPDRSRPHNDPTLQYRNPNPLDPWAFASSPLHSDPLGSAWVEPLHQHQLGSSADGSTRHWSNHDLMDTDLMDTEDVVSLMDAPDARMRSPPRSQVSPGGAANQASTSGSGADWTSQHASSPQDFWNDLHLSPLRSGSSEARQQQYLGSPAGDASVVSGHPLASGPHEMSQRMAARGSWSSPSSSSPYLQAGPSSLPGEQPQQRRRRRPHGLPRPSEGEKEQHQAEAYSQGYRKSELAMRLSALDEQQLHNLATDAFDPAKTALQAPLLAWRGFEKTFEKKGYVYSTLEQTEIIQEILNRRLKNLNDQSFRPNHLRLEYNPIVEAYDSTLGRRLRAVMESEAVPSGPIESYLQAFELGKYVIYIHNRSAGSHAVFAYPQVKISRGGKKYNRKDPKTVYLGILYLERASAR